MAQDVTIAHSHKVCALKILQIESFLGNIQTNFFDPCLDIFTVTKHMIKCFAHFTKPKIWSCLYQGKKRFSRIARYFENLNGTIEGTKQSNLCQSGTD